MKTSKRNKLLSLALAGSCGLFGASNALADAGDTISNRATLSYDVGAVAQTVIESDTGAGNSTPGLGAGGDTDFIEDRVINFTVVDSGVTGNAVPSGTLQATAFTITNDSNIALDFLLRGLNNADGTADPQGGTVDEFDVSAIQTFVEDGTTAGFQSAEDTAIFVAALPEGSSATVYVVATIPLVDSGANPLVNTNVAVMTLVAQAATGGAGDGTGAIMRDDNGNVSPGDGGAGAFSNGTATLTTVAAVNALDAPGAMDTVFNEPLTGTQNGAGAADDAVNPNAQHSSDNSYTIQTAELTVAKVSAALWDPVNLDSNPKSIPGGYVRYTITISNAVGAANADLTTLSDALVAALDLDLDFGNGTAANNPTSVVGDAIQITHVDNAVTNFCTGDVADADADGCSYTGGAGGIVSADIFAVMGAANAQLAAGESLTITFNAIVQ
ncbi:hypothetical protein MNBD_GAMMA05-1366 [hydrothermal vent metagenome]|uniref:DUF11 domain-containing protein n=1 Tax=hydrothermal vent metagenome TaxID=652676 RepID=A0A3B0WI80_9ZZZZ